MAEARGRRNAPPQELPPEIETEGGSASETEPLLVSAETITAPPMLACLVLVPEGRRAARLSREEATPAGTEIVEVAAVPARTPDADWFAALVERLVEWTLARL